MSDLAALAVELKAEALDRGWAAAGIAAVEPLPAARERGLEAVRSGRMADMAWMSEARIHAATDLGARYPWGRSLLALAWPYRPVAPLAGVAGDPARGRVAAYACLSDDGTVVDYHELLAARCDALLTWLRARDPGLRAKRFVDHGWAMDRAIAERAGLGFAGKHASLLTTSAGSYVLLAEILLSTALPSDSVSAKGCGSCSACLPACPTGAIVAPGVIDARRCISYLTIEHRGSIPEPLRPLMGTWVFGCDLCQEACPINHRLAPPPRSPGSASTRSGPVPHPDLLELLRLDEAAFQQRFAGTAVQRTGRASLARNAAIALANAGARDAVPALAAAARDDDDAAVREAAEWALARLLVEEPDGRAGAGSDGAPHARGHQRDRVGLDGPPGVRQRAAHRHA